MSKAQRHDRIVELMDRVGIPVPEKRMHDYPHQFSGGMLQRTLIAIALASDPQILIADEPTTALDVIIQDQILSLLVDLQRDLGMSMVLVSHDLSVIAQVCDRVAVMYGGQIVELADTADLLQRPQHPYTAALLKSLPGAVPRDQPLTTITGSPPRLIGLPETCRYLPRCDFAEDACTTWDTALLPADRAVADATTDATTDSTVRCRRHDVLELAQTVYVPREAPDVAALIEPVHALSTSL
jgi:peptide/nickel transport system ATP-binding protein/oligopeptide transport system ATP-binding protein